MNTMQSHGSGVPDMIGSLSEPDILASQQYYDQETSGRQPERSLMFAVLLDAVECFQNMLFCMMNMRLVFSFINICDALTIDPQYLRKGLLRWKRNVLQLSARKDRNKRSA